MNTLAISLFWIYIHQTNLNNYISNEFYSKERYMEINKNNKK